MNSRGLKQAYDAQDLAFATLCEYRATIAPNGKPHKLSSEEANTLANLVNAFLACQERVRIHRRVPLPGTASPKANRKTASRRAREVTERPAVAPEPPRGQTSMTSAPTEGDVSPGPSNA